MTRMIPQFATAAAVTALIALGASGAWAQSSTSNSPGAAPPPARSTTSNVPAAPSSAPMKDPLASEDISQIQGSSVAARDGSSIGKISTVLMDPSSKKVDRLVVAEGGVLGVGAHKVALPVDQFRWDAQNHNFVIQKTADDLKAMPEWKQPQLAETPRDTSPPRDSGVAAGTSAGAPAGAVTAPMAPAAPAPSGNAR